MDDKPKRRWFQIHLSTAIVLMFAAGLLIGLNLNETQRIIVGYKITTVERKHITIDSPQSQFELCAVTGWPWIFSDYSPSKQQQITLNATIRWPDVQTFSNSMALPVSAPRFRYEYLCLDIVVLIAILAAIASVSEFVVRRHRRKPPA